jgi:hypothetical protein
MYKKGNEQDRHYPNRFFVFILLLGILFIADESLKLIKDKPTIVESYCQKTQMDPSTAEFKPIFDYILKVTASMPKYHELDRMLPCVVISKIDFKNTTGVGAFNSFDISMAKKDYLPINVSKNLDISNTKLAAITMSHPLFMAYNFMQEKESAEGNVASCLQRLVNGYDDSSLFIIGSGLDKDTGADVIPGVNDPNISKSQRDQISNLNFQFQYFYVDSLVACKKSLDGTDSPGFQACTLEEKLNRIEDFVYNEPAYRKYCAYK